METKEKETNTVPVSKPIPALKPSPKPVPIVLEPDEENSIESLTEQAQKTLFNFLKELQKTKEGIDNLEQLKELIEKINSLKEEHKDNEDYQKVIDEILNRMETKLSAFVKEAPDNISEEELKELLNNLFKNKVPVSVDLSGINIAKIVELYGKLQEAINNKEEKKETAARGRLIRLLKKEQKNINESFKDIETIAKIGFELSKDNTSLESIKQLLEQDENKNLYLYFKDYLNDLESFINRYQTVIEDEEIQRLFFLGNALSEQLKEHGKNLDNRFSKEFLENKSKLTSIFTELPNAIALSIKKLNNSINELKQAKNQRRKLHSIMQVMTDVSKVIGTPLLFTGKYLMSNWYTLYMAYQGITQSREQAERERQAQAEAEARAKAEAEAAEKARLEAEAEKARLEAEAAEQARLEAEAAEQARLEAEAAEQARLEAEAAEQARLEAEAAEQARLEAEAAERERQAQAEAEARAKAEAEAKARQEATETQDVDVEPTTIPDQYLHLQGADLISLIVNGSFQGNIYEQFKYGVVTPDSVAHVHYLPPGVPWWQFWRIESGEFTLRELQVIFNWWPDTNLDEFAASFQKGK